MAVTSIVKSSNPLGPSTRKLAITGKSTLCGEFRQPDGCYVQKKFDLCTVLDVHEGEL